MGHSKTTVVVTHVTLVEDQLVPTKLGFSCDTNLGCLNFDMKLFQHLATICSKQYNTEVMDFIAYLSTN
jgi:hypothetical protein